VRQLEPKFAVANGVPALQAPPYTPQTTRDYASTQKQTRVRDRGGLFTPAQQTLSDSDADTVSPKDSGFYPCSESEALSEGYSGDSEWKNLPRQAL